MPCVLQPPVWHTTATVAWEPLVIHIFAPLSTQPPAVSLAVVIIPAGLEP
jgi:hypothetical protein